MKHGSPIKPTLALTVTIELPAQVETIKLTIGPHTCLRALDKGVTGEDGPILCSGLMRVRRS